MAMCLDWELAEIERNRAERPEEAVVCVGEEDAGEGKGTDSSRVVAR